MIRTGLFRPSSLSFNRFHGARLASRQLSNRSRIVFSDFAIPKRNYRSSIKPRRFSTYTGVQSHVSGTTAKVSSFAGASIAFALLFSAAGLWFGAEVHADETEIVSPLKGDYLGRLPEKHHPAAKERLSVLDVSGMNQQELSATLNWLKTRHHGFMYLKGKVEDPSASAATLQKISEILQGKAKAFQDRASHYECAQFAVLCYQSADEIRRSLKGEGLSDWELLPTDMSLNPVYVDRPSGYGGVAFVNHKQGLVVVAHRGTEVPHASIWDPEKFLKDWWEFFKDLYADRGEIVQKKVGGQQEAAVLFSDSVFEKLHAKGYRIGCVGHSLGGWLAQLTAAHLVRQLEHEDAYAVCLDSPGAKEMLDGIYRDRYGMGPDRELDITNFVLWPNVFNAAGGTHAGTLYQVKAPDLQGLDPNIPGDYSLKTHNANTILSAFYKGESEKMKQYVVEDWPQVDWAELESGVVSSLSEIEWMNFWRVAKNPRDAQAWGALVTNVGKSIYSLVSSAAEGTSEYGSFFDQVDLSKVDDLRKSSFKRRYLARYKVRPFEEEETRKIHASPKAQKLLNFFSRASVLLPEKDVLERFLSRHVPTELLQSLLLVPKARSTEKTFRLEKGSAQKLVLEAERLVRCLPEFFVNIPLLDLSRFSTRNARYLELGNTPFPSKASFFPLSPSKQVVRTAVIKEVDGALEQGSVVCVVGPSGSGKTEVVRQVMEATEKRAWYFDTSDAEIFEREWRNFAFFDVGVEDSLTVLSSLSIKDVTGKVYEQLGANILLVFDGSPDVFEIRQYLPPTKQTKGPQVLCTAEPGNVPETIGVVTVSLEEQANAFTDKELEQLISREKKGKQSVEAYDSIVREFPGVAPLLPAFLQAGGSEPVVQEEVSEKPKQGYFGSFSLGSILMVSRDTNKVTPSVSREDVVAAAIAPYLSSDEEYSVDNLLLFTLSLVRKEGVTCQFLEEWLTSECAARALEGAAVSKKEVEQSLKKFEQSGVVAVLGKEKEHILPNRAVVDYLQAKERFSSEFSSVARTWYREFFLGSSSLRNMKEQEYRLNKRMASQLEHFLGSKRFAPSAYTQDSSPVALREAVENLKLLNAVGNNELQGGSILSSFLVFSKVRRACEQLTGIETGVAKGEDVDKEKARDIVDKMNVLRGRGFSLPLVYARSIHYLGKIAFQSGSKEEAEKLFAWAVALREEELGEKRAKDPDTELVIFNRNGKGWVLLGEEDPKKWKEATQLYHKLYRDEVHPFNHYYSNLQLGKSFYKRARETKDRIDKRHYYSRAMERLKFGGERRGVPFEGALVIGKRHGYADAEPSVCLLMGQVLGDPDNPFCDFVEAERLLLHVLDLSAKKPENRSVKSRFLFSAYCSLAKLYDDQITLTAYTENLRSVHNEILVAKKEGALKKAMQWLNENPKRDMDLAAQKEEIRGLQDLYFS